MKKFLFLLLAAGLSGSAQAQSSKTEEARRVILGEPTDDRRVVYNERGSRYPETYPSEDSRSRRMEQVNREYDAKIHSIRNNRSLSSGEKTRIIRQLEADRDRRIQTIQNEYGRNRYDKRKYDDRRDRDKDDDRRYHKKDKGKHLGWTKGKGNQKKYKNRD